MKNLSLPAYLLLICSLLVYAIPLSSQAWPYLEDLEDDLDRCSLPTCTSSYIENSATTDEPSSMLKTAVKGWMGKLPDNQLLRKISIPGTHDSGATIGGVGAETQNWTIAEQLAGGIRLLDIRCKINKNKDGFGIYHGDFYQDLTFDEVMESIQDFLSTNPSEGIIMRLEKEDKGYSQEDSSAADIEEMDEFIRIWNTYATTFASILTDPITDPAGPRLSDIRGQVMVMRQFQLNHNTIAPDKIGFGFFNSNKNMQNEYSVYAVPLLKGVSIAKKKDLVKEYINKAAGSSEWTINWLSGAYGMTPEHVAWETNRAAFDHLDTKPGKTNVGTLIMDFPGEGLIYRIIKTNFDYYQKREYYVQMDCYQPGVSGSGTDDKITVSFYNGSENLGSVIQVPDCDIFSDAKFKISTIALAKKVGITHVVIGTGGEDAFYIDELFLKKSSGNFFVKDQTIAHWGAENGSGWVFSTDTSDKVNGVSARSCRTFTVEGEGNSAGDCTPPPIRQLYTVEIDCYGHGYDEAGTENYITVSFYNESKFLGSYTKIPDCGQFSDAKFEVNAAFPTHFIIETSGQDAFYMDEVHLKWDGRHFMYGNDDVGGWVLSTDPNDGFGDGSPTSSCFQFGIFPVKNPIPCQPIARCKQAVTKALGRNNGVNLSFEDVDDGSIAVAGELSPTLSSSFLECEEIGQRPVTLTVENALGESNSCQTTLIVLDTFPPIAKCQNIEVALDAFGNKIITADQIDDGSVDYCSLHLELSTATFSCSDIGGNEVMLYAYDDNDNVDSCMATVTVLDTPPLAKCKDITVFPNFLGQAKVAPLDVDDGSTIYCSSAEMDLSLSRTSFSCADIGFPIPVILTVTDEKSRWDTCTTYITIEDLLPPTTQCINGVTPRVIQLDASGQAGITIADIRLYSNDYCGIASSSLDRTQFDCSDIGLVTVKLTDIDNSGNTNSCTSRLMIVDQLPPVARCEDLIWVLEENDDAYIPPKFVGEGSTDNCGIASYSLDKDYFDCTDLGDNAVVLTVTDRNGNAATCSATITILDRRKPTALCKDVTLDFVVNNTVTLEPAQVNNGSFDNCGSVELSLDIDTFTCEDVNGEPRTVVLTVTDTQGNISTCTAQISLEDKFAPLVTCRTSHNVFLDAGGNAELSATAFYITPPTDPCGAVSSSLSQHIFGCSDIGATIVTATATDIHGNSRSCNTTVSIFDNIPPNAQCKNITVTLSNALGMASILPADIDNSSTDNCGIAERNIDTDTFTCDDIGSPQTVTLTVKDGQGNTSSCTALVTVEDTFAPNVTCLPVPRNVFLDANGEATISPVDIYVVPPADACGVASTVLSKTDYDCTDIGSPTVRLTTTDIHGNSRSCNTTLIVQDKVAPEARCQDRTVELDALGQGLITAAEVDNISTDACGIQSISLDKTNFTCLNLGLNQVTLTVLDKYDNSAGCTASINVLDVTPPAVAAAMPFIKKKIYGVNYGARDACDPDPAIVSVMVVPVLENPNISFKVKKKTNLSIDLKKNTVKVDAPDPEAFWMEIQELGGIRVSEGQQLNLDPTTKGSYNFDFDKNGALEKISGPTIILQCTATDASGNTAIATASPFENSSLINTNTGSELTNESLPDPGLVTEKMELTLFPNPFSAGLNIHFSLLQAEEVLLEVFSLTGQRVWIQPTGILVAGAHEYLWDGTAPNGARLSPGIYLLRLSNGKEVIQQKIVLK